MAADLSPLRILLAMGLAALTSAWLDHRTQALGFLPPGFRVAWRRAAGLGFLGLFFFLVFALPVALAGMGSPEPPRESVAWPELFAVQALMVAGLAGWFALGYAGLGLPFGETFARQFGLRVDSWKREVLIGLGAGVVGWIGMLLSMLAAVGVLLALGFEEVVPQQPASLVALIAGLPFLVRAALAACAGLVEETFFRGFLQPRMGVLASTLLFLVGHLSYDQPLMLVGITFLSLFFAALVLWRRSVVAAIVAHAAFDAFQLLVLVPQVLGCLVW